LDTIATTVNYSNTRLYLFSIPITRRVLDLLKGLPFRWILYILDQDWWASLYVCTIYTYGCVSLSVRINVESLWTIKAEKFKLSMQLVSHPHIIKL